jgi:hypothetical protein
MSEMSLGWRPNNWDKGTKWHYNKLTEEVYESGADAMLNALFELAKQSPTGKFEIDSTKVNR